MELCSQHNELIVEFSIATFSLIVEFSIAPFSLIMITFTEAEQIFCRAVIAALTNWVSMKVRT